MTTTCPEPYKIRHGNRTDATAHQRALEQYRKARDLNVYRCGDHWHVGHSVIALSKRIRRALRRNP